MPRATRAAAVAATETLEEVVVSARMREEDLRDVPISIVAIDAEALAQRGATELRNLGDVVPNVIIGTGNSERRTNLVIRGISTEARSIGQETGVGVYLDGVYTGRAETYNQRLPDIAQVEFLRGPQGTIFGKNTIAGAISLTTSSRAMRSRAHCRSTGATMGMPKPSGTSVVRSKRECCSARSQPRA